MATPPGPDAAAVSRHRRTRQNASVATARKWQWIAIPALAVVALALAIVLPNSPPTPAPSQIAAPEFLPAEPANISLASWQAAPTVLAGPELNASQAACLAVLTGVDENSGAEFIGGEDFADGLVINERRGDWALLAFTEPSEGFGTCLMWAEPGHEPVTLMARALPGVGQSTPWGRYRSELLGELWMGLGQDATSGLEPPAPGWILPRVHEHVTIFADDDAETLRELTLVVGQVGPNVVGVTLHTFTSGDVEATVGGGWYSAWWPGGMGGQVCAWTHREDGEDVGWGCDPASGFTLTLNDGTTVYRSLEEIEQR